MKFLPILAALCVLAPAVSDAQSPAQIVDGRTATERGWSGKELRVSVPLTTNPDEAVAYFLDVAGERGARYAGELKWLWLVNEGRRVRQCSATLSFRYAGSTRGPAWRVDVGRSRCRAIRGRPGMADSEIRGQLYAKARRRAPKRMSRAEMRRMAKLLEPSEPRRRRVRRRAKAKPKPQRRDWQNMADQLE